LTTVYVSRQNLVTEEQTCSYVKRVKVRKAGTDKDVARRHGEDKRERIEENGAEHSTDIRVVGGFSADRKLEIEDRRRAETKAI